MQVSKKVRNKTKDDDDLQITVNQLMAKIKDLTSDNKGYVDKTHYRKERIVDLDVDIKETNDLSQARIKARNKELEKILQVSKGKETEVN